MSEDTIKGNDSIKTVDLRKALNYSPAKMTRLLKKIGLSGRVVDGASARKILEEAGYTYPSGPKIIGLLIFKGGTAKTTTTKFLSERLAAYGNKVLIIDADPQANLTSSFKLEDYHIKLTPEDPVLTDVLDKKSGVKIEDAVLPITPNLDILPSTPVNSKCDNVIRDNYKNPLLPLKRILQPLKQYDYILIDCGPSMSITNTAVMGAAHTLLLPVDPDDFSRIGIEQTLEEVEDIKKELGQDNFAETKMFLTKYDEREFLSISMLTEMRKTYGDNVLKTHIRRSTDLKNSVFDDVDLFTLPGSRARADYDDLCREVMEL